MSYQIGMNPVIDSSLVLYYDPKNPKCYGTYNLLQYTEDFTNAYWTKGSVTLTPNATLAPDGTLTATKVSETNVTAGHNIQLNPRTGTNETLTLSVYAKAAERNWLLLGQTNAVNSDVRAWFDLQNGVVGSLTLFAGGTDYSNPKSTIENVGNGWYRCSVTVTKASVNTNNIPSISVVSGNDVNSFLGTTGFGIYVWGAQLTYGKNVLPYVPRLANAALSTTTNNLIAGSNNGTLTNGVIPNVSDGVFTFDGVNDYITMGSFTGLGSIDRTVSVWFNLAANNGVVNRIITFPLDDTNTDQPTLEIFVDNTLKINAGNGGTPYNGRVIATNAIVLGTWHNTVLTVTGKTSKVYIDGVFIGTATSTGTVATNPISYLGRYNQNYGQYLNGSIALPMLYNRVLTADEVKQNYQATKTRFIQ